MVGKRSALDKEKTPEICKVREKKSDGSCELNCISEGCTELGHTEYLIRLIVLNSPHIQIKTSKEKEIRVRDRITPALA